MRILIIVLILLFYSLPTNVTGEEGWRPWDTKYSSWGCMLDTHFEQSSDESTFLVYVSFGRLTDKEAYLRSDHQDVLQKDFARNVVQEGDLTLMVTYVPNHFFDGSSVLPVDAVEIGGEELRFTSQGLNNDIQYFFDGEPTSTNILKMFMQGQNVEFILRYENGKVRKFIYSRGKDVGFSVNFAQFQACIQVLSDIEK